MDCLHAGRCSKAQEVELRTVLEGYRCSQWVVVDSATSDARRELLDDTGTPAVRAFIQVPTPKYEEPPMSDRDTRIETLNDMSRPDVRKELKTAIYEASGKDLRAIAKAVDPAEKSWADDDEECQTQAVKKTLRLQKPQLIDLLIKAEFPEEEKKTTRGRRAAKKAVEKDDDDDNDDRPEVTEVEEKATKRPVRRRRSAKKDVEEEKEEKEEEKPDGVSFDMDTLVEAIVEAFGPTLDGIAKVVLENQAALEAIKKGQIALAIGVLGLDDKEAPETHTDLLEMFELEG